MSNPILELKGTYEHKGAMPPGPPSLPKGQSVSAEHLEELLKNLEECRAYWQTQHLGINYLIVAKYQSTVAKSNRCKRLLAENSDNASDSIVGARFEQIPGSPSGTLRHVITYCVSPGALDKTLSELAISAQLLHSRFSGFIDSDRLSALDKKTFDSFGMQISRTTFAQIIRDSYYLVGFEYCKSFDKDYSTDAFVTVYETGKDTFSLLKLIVPELDKSQVFENCVRLYPDQYEKLRREAPYLIAMSTANMANLDLRQLWSSDAYNKYKDSLPSLPTIPSPGDEPVIGVIDTLFNRDAYFSEWVDDLDCMPHDINRNQDVSHGTEVASIIVDGPTLNPELDDGCGRFRVKLFGITDGEKMNSLTVMRDIKRIVEHNQGIKVWNLSLGTVSECPENSISPVASILDELQAKYDVVFVVSGTNLGREKTAKRVGSPADSINSIVVNAVDRNGTPTDYSRHGPVLSFFGKPDIGYYGGTEDDPMVVSAPYALVKQQGTSFAAPWIARKLAFLIYRARLSREEAKALLIDSAYRWGENGLSDMRGYGVPPISIEDILGTPNNEIRFILTGAISSYETYNYGIPVPVSDGRYPFMARATLCYFPECHRSQGVDYATTEIDLHFGRIQGKGIKSLDKNTQGDEGAQVYEAQARALFRKWDNIKHIGDVVKSRFAPRKAYDNPQWGIMLRKKERNDPNAGTGIKFAVVVTLREMYGVNRLEEFVQRCSLRGWIVNRIDIETINEIYAAAEVDIDFDD